MGEAYPSFDRTPTGEKREGLSVLVENDRDDAEPATTADFLDSALAVGDSRPIEIERRGLDLAKSNMNDMNWPVENAQ